jgi:hypothetical protein
LLPYSNFLSTSQAIAAFTKPSHHYQDQMEFMVNEHNSLHQRRNAVPSILTASQNLVGNIFNNDFTSNLAAINWKKVYNQLKYALGKKWKKINPFRDTEGDGSDDEEEDVDLDQIEEIARKQLMAKNPELYKSQQDGDDDGGGGLGDFFENNSNVDDRSVSQDNAGDQVVPFEEL